MESREHDVGSEARPSGGPIAELVDNDEPLRDIDDVVDSILATGSAVVEYVHVIDPNAPLVDSDYTDEEGRRWKVKAPLGSSAPASMGIPVGPPDISDLGLPFDVSVRLHNQLFNRGLFTKRDLRGRGQEVFAAVQAAYRVDVQAVTALYQ